MRAKTLSLLGVPLLIVSGVAATYAPASKSVSNAELCCGGVECEPQVSKPVAVKAAECPPCEPCPTPPPACPPCDECP